MAMFPMTLGDRDYIKSYQRDDTSHPKWAWFGSCDPFLHAQLLINIAIDVVSLLFAG